jgi:hypothetical protein
MVFPTPSQDNYNILYKIVKQLYELFLLTLLSELILLYTRVRAWPRGFD